MFTVGGGFAVAGLRFRFLGGDAIERRWRSGHGVRFPIFRRFLLTADIAVVGLRRAIVPSPAGVAETRVDIGADSVTGAIQRYVVARAFRTVDIRINAAASLVDANLNKKKKRRKYENGRLRKNKRKQKKRTRLLPQGVPSRTIPKSGRSAAATVPLVILHNGKLKIREWKQKCYDDTNIDLLALEFAASHGDKSPRIHLIHSGDDWVTGPHLALQRTAHDVSV